MSNFKPNIFIPSNIRSNKRNNDNLTEIKNPSINLLEWLGIDLKNGDNTLFLNKKGEWIESGGGSSWLLTGNAGTDPDSNFVGTTDSADFKVGIVGDSIFTTYSTAKGGIIANYAPIFSINSASETEFFSVDTGTGLSAFTSDVAITGSLKLSDETEGAGKFLISDASGNASWSNTVEVDLGGGITGGFSLDQVAGEILSFVVNSNTGEGAGVISKNNAGNLECEISWTSDGVTDSNRVRVTQDGIILNSYDGSNNYNLLIKPTQLVITGLQDFANDAAAATGGIEVGGLYRDSATEYLRARKV